MTETADSPSVSEMCLHIVADAAEAAANNHELAIQNWSANIGNNKSTPKPKWSHLEIAALRVLASACRAELGEENE